MSCVGPKAVSLSLLDGRGPRVRPGVFPERTLVMSTKITTTTPPADKYNKEQGWHANTDLGCDLKTLLCSDRKLKARKNYTGVLRLDSEPIVDEFLCRDPHYTFTESAQSAKVCHRNPYHYQGQHVSCTISPDGKPRLNFKQLKLDADFDKYRYAREVMNEVIQALDLSGL